MTPESRLKRIRELKEVEGDLFAWEINDEEYIAIRPFIFTYAIIRGLFEDSSGYEDRWCYDHLPVALAAATKWIEEGCVGEPLGWHRHPGSGRRRLNGDPSTEYINH